MRWLLVSLVLFVVGCATVPASKCEGALDEQDIAFANLVREFPGKTRGLSKGQIQAVFESNSQRFENIYQQALSQGKIIEGTVVLGIVLDTSGRVAEARVLSECASRFHVTRRLIALIKTLEFPHFDGAGYFVFWYPLHLEYS